MPEKDYYIILGVPRSESTEGIKSAFRKLAKKYHPDKSGKEGTRLFQEILEAYETLSDPESRRQYTEQLVRRESRRSFGPGFSRHTRRGFSPFAGGGGRSLDEMVDELFSEIFGDFSGSSFWENMGPFAYPPGRIDFELFLTGREAAEGGVLPLRIEVPSICPTCAGSGEVFPFICPACDGGGSIRRRVASLRVKIPAGIRSGAVLKGVVGFEWGEVVVRIHVTVRGRAD